MKKDIKNLKGSEKRDIFKWAHKNKMGNADFYAADADLCLITNSKKNPGVVAYLDYKDVTDDITYTERFLYDEWTASKPVFIVEAADPENGPFTIYQYKSGGGKKRLCNLENWEAFMSWEAEIRRNHCKENTP